MRQEILLREAGLPVSNIIRSNEAQVWFISGDVVDVPLAKAD